MSSPNISVTAIITAMTDSEKPFVKEAIDSVLSQSTPCKLRIYVEQSNNWVREFIPDNKKQSIVVRYVPLQPSGIIRNTGVGEADTEWIAFLDGDDVWMPNKIEAQLNAASKRDVEMVAADHYMINEKGNVLACSLGGNRVPMTSSWMAKRYVFIHHPFSAKLTGQDSEWWFKNKQIKKYRVPSFLIKYRLRQVSASSLTPTKIRKMKVLKYASIPFMRYIIFAATWLANKVTAKR